MAVYRQIHVSFWQDEFILDLDPNEKYFYLYLMTNSKTTQSGIYELPKKIMVLETELPIDTLSILLKKFIDIGKILYSEETREVFLLNWLKHNSIKSPKVFSCVEKELKGVKDKRLLRVFADKCKDYGYPIPTVCVEYLKGSQPGLDPYGEEEEKEKEKEEEKEQQEEEPKSINADELNPIKFYQENGFGAITPHVGNKVFLWVDDLSNELVIHAMKIAIENGVIKWNYVEAILKDWANKNIKTVEEVQALEVKRVKQGGKITKDEKIPQYIQDQMEKRKSGQTVEEEGLSEEAEERKRKLLASLGVTEDEPS